MADPFSDVYAAVITVLLASPSVTALVDADNIVRLDTEIEPLIDDRNVGDLPMLMLTPVPGGENNLHHTSDTAQFVRSYELIYATDEEKLAATYGLNALDYAVMRALYSNMPRLGCPYISWFELGEWGPLTPMDVDNQAEQERGWQSRMTIDIIIEVQHVDLQE